jgi:hypothetical protein
MQNFGNDKIKEEWRKNNHLGVSKRLEKQNKNHILTMTP